MENQEQKSQSENTLLEEPLVLSVEPLPSPYKAVIELSFDVLREKFDEYWRENEVDTLAKYPVHAKKEKGGKVPTAKKLLENNVPLNKLYARVLFDVLRDSVADVFFVEHVGLNNFKKGQNAEITGIFYTYPELELEEPISYKVKRVFSQDANEQWENRKLELQHKYKVKTPYEGEDIREDHDILMDIHASCEGEPHEQGTFHRQWVEWKLLNIPKLKEELLKHKKGDLFEISYELDPKKAPEMEGKTVEAQVKIYELQTVEYPEVDDSLAKQESFDSLEELEKTFKEEYARYMQQAEKSVIADHLINEILTKSRIPLLPTNWVKSALNTIIEQNIMQFGGDKEKLMNAVGATTEERLHEIFKAQVHRDALQILAVRKYADMHKLDVPEEDNEDIFRHMMDHVEWVEEDDNA